MMNLTTWNIGMLFFVLSLVYDALGIILPKVVYELWSSFLEIIQK